LRAAQLDLRVAVGEERAHLWQADATEAGSDGFDARLSALKMACKARQDRGEVGGDELIGLRCQLAAMLVDDKSDVEASRLCRQLLESDLSDALRAEIRGCLGFALLRLKKVSDALPYLGDYVARAPTDPAHVLPVASALPRSHAAEICGMLQPVIAQAPRQGDTSWTEALGVFYACLTPRAARKSAVASLLGPNVVEVPVPTQWGGQTWRSGYRQWRPYGQNPGKVGSGKQGIRALLPFSKGWHKTGQPPAELRRWGRAPIVFQRGTDGPTLVVYWFAPDLGYWYGSTPRTQGVTGKTVRGFNKGGIARLVADIAYGEDHKSLGGRPRSTRPLPFKLGLGSGQLRKAWRVGDVLYDETFFSIGQVTGEVLMRIRAADVDVLEPELRWLYRNLRVTK